MMKIRVLVVEDSLTVRKRLVEILANQPEMTVVGEAVNGKEAIEFCQRLRPDLITLDMALPVMSGLAATEHIMAYNPTPILIVSASTNRGDMFKTYDALAAGAVDVLEKQCSEGVDLAWEEVFVAKARTVAQIKVIRHIRPGRFNSVPEIRQEPGTAEDIARQDDYRVVAIGASTGGPAACATILRSLPADFPLPILMVIHIGPTFGEFLADWLDSQASVRVRLAEDGAVLSQLPPGHVFMAPPDRHLVVCNGRLRLTSDAERHSCRPSVDVLFESLAVGMAPQTIACLLSGMGKDGAHGLLCLRQRGARTLAQDEESSVVFGMPQEAIRLGAAEQVCSVEEFAPALVSLTGGVPR